MAAENTADPTAPDTILLIQGLWMTPRSWEKWVERSERPQDRADVVACRLVRDV